MYGNETRPRLQPYSILIVLACIWVPSVGLGQQVSHSLRLSRGVYSTDSILNYISKKKNYVVNYSENYLDLSKNISVLGDESIRDIVKKIIEQQKLAVRLKKGYIDIYPVAKSSKVIKYSVFGHLADASTGEALIGATVKVGKSGSGAISNDYGFFSLSLDPRIYFITFSYIGYQPVTVEVDLRTNSQKTNIRLNPIVSALSEVVVKEDVMEYEIIGSPPGTHRLDPKNIGDIPYFLGEVDVLQEALLLPGIRNLSEESIGLNVRGGAVDQNLIMLDEGVIYNSSHYFGLFSVFNPDAVNKVTLFKGYIPANYGGRASSVIRVQQKEGNTNRFRVQGGMGLASARILIEGPVKRLSSSYLASFRTSMPINIVNQSELEASRFNDLNFKWNTQLSKKTKFFVSSYFGNDVARGALGSDKIWGNRLLTLRLSKIFNNRVFGNLSTTLSDYQYRASASRGDDLILETSRVTNLNNRFDVSYFVNPEFNIEMGWDFTYHFLNPGERTIGNKDSIEVIVEPDVENGIEPAFYLSVDKRINDRLSVMAGLRYSTMFNIGPANLYGYEANKSLSDNSIIDTTVFREGELIKSFKNIEPRIALTYACRSSSIKISYSTVNQYIHLISNTLSPSPTDIWKLSGPYLPPTTNTSYSIAYLHYARKIGLKSSVEFYHKRQKNLINYKSGADLVLKPNVETELLFGDGNVYGVEVLCERKFGNLKGWVSYTLSRSEVRVTGEFPSESINRGRYFPTDFDRTHYLTLSSIYRLNPRISFSANFVLGSGRPITFPVGKQEFENLIVPIYDLRNDQRLPTYHRFDLSLKLASKKINKHGERKRGKDFWVLSIYNVYSKNNVNSYFFQQNPNQFRSEIVEFSVLKSVFPSLTYNFTF